MTNRYIKWCPLTNNQRNEEQNCGYRLTPGRMATIKKKKKDKYWQDVYKEEPFHNPQGYKMVQSLWKTAWRFLQILKNRTIVYFHKLTSGMEIRILKKYLHSHVRCSIIHYNQDMGTL